MTRYLLLAALVQSLGIAADLHEAARTCDEERIKALLSKSVALNELDSDGETPLHLAVQSGKARCVNMLVRAGADIAKADSRGRTASDHANALRDEQARALILFILRASRREQPSGAAPWSLEYASIRGQTDVVAMLLRMGADPNVLGTQGTTPLHDACLKAKPDLVRLLLTHGAKVALFSKTGRLPIHDAALGGSGEVVQELVAKGADVHAKVQGTGETPLHIAAAWGKLDVIRLLIALHAPVDAKDDKGRTPRDAAQAAGSEEAVALLTAAASPQPRSKERSTR